MLIGSRLLLFVAVLLTLLAGLFWALPVSMPLPANVLTDWQTDLSDEELEALG